MDSDSTGLSNGNPIDVGTRSPSNAIAAFGSNDYKHKREARYEGSSMHLGTSTYDAAPVAMSQPGELRAGHYGIQDASLRRSSPGQTSGSSSFFENVLESGAATATSRHSHSTTPPPTRMGGRASTSTTTTNMTIASLTTSETAGTPGSVASSPVFEGRKAVWSINQGSEAGPSTKASRRRTGPLTEEARKNAAIMRKIGACADCRRRRVACNPSHHGMTWEEAARKTGTSASNSPEPIALSPKRGFCATNTSFVQATDEVDLDHSPTTPSRGQPPLKMRKPLPEGPRPLERTAQEVLSMTSPHSKATMPYQSENIILSNIDGLRYKKVHALLLTWYDEWQDKNFEGLRQAVKGLRSVLTDSYNISCRLETIPNSDAPSLSWKWLQQTTRAFLDESDSRDTLKIVYYNGNSFLNAERDMVIASSLGSKSPHIKWSSVQALLEYTVSDTLVIMDAPYFGVKTSKQHGQLEVLARGSFEEYTGGSPLARYAFTTALTEKLHTRALQTKFRGPLSAAELHAELCAEYPALIEDMMPEREFLTRFPLPLHIHVVGENTISSSIRLAPRPPPSYQSAEGVAHAGRRSRAELSPPATSAFDLRIQFNDHDIDQEKLREWLRMIPVSAQEIKVWRAMTP